MGEEVTTALHSIADAHSRDGETVDRQWIDGDGVASIMLDTRRLRLAAARKFSRFLES